MGGYKLMKKDIYDELKELMENDELKKYTDLFKALIEAKVNEVINEDTKISINKKADGTAKANITGSRMGVLVTLAGLEKTILKQLDAPAGLFEIIKDVVETMEV